LATTIGALAAVLTMIPAALGQCGLPSKFIKPSSWQPEFQGARVVPAQLVTDPIVGMWHVVLTATSMNNQPFSGVIDNSVVVWHNDGTEVMNSGRPAQDGDFCLGVWAHTGLRKYFLNHIPLGRQSAGSDSGQHRRPTGWCPDHRAGDFKSQRKLLFGDLHTDRIQSRRIPVHLIRRHRFGDTHYRGNQIPRPPVNR
jgi:hypothetical protein